MNKRHGVLGVLIAGLLLVLAATALPGPWRPAKLRATPQAPVIGVKGAEGVAGVQGTAAVRTIPEGTHVAAPPGQKSATFYWLEGQATRLTARYADTVVVVERGGDGDILSRVSDANGNERARFNVDSATDTLLYMVGADNALQAMNDSKVRPTLDWAHRQAYSLWKGGTAKLAWKGGLMRSPTHPDAEPSELEIAWKDGLAARVLKKTNAKSMLVENGTKKQRIITGPALVGRLMKDGVEIGSSSWYPREQLFMWRLPNTSGFIEAKHLVSNYGGWPFTPDQEWVNLQTIAFYHFKSQIDSGGFVARNGRGCPAEGSSGSSSLAALTARVKEFFAPTLLADQSGCDGLHWLDGTTLRFCCDIHDACYAKYGCDYNSWWRIWKSWTCDYCNMNVIMCFADGGCSCFPGYGWLQPIEAPHNPLLPQANT